MKKNLPKFIVLNILYVALSFSAPNAIADCFKVPVPPGSWVSDGNIFGLCDTFNRTAPYCADTSVFYHSCKTSGDTPTTEQICPGGLFGSTTYYSNYVPNVVSDYPNCIGG